MNYGAIIERAARMILRYRYLWLLGLLGGESFSAPTTFARPFPAPTFAGPFPGPFPPGATVIPGSGVYYYGPSPAPTFIPFPSPPPGAVDMRTFFSQHAGVIAAILLAALLAIVIFLVWYFVVGPIATGGLVRAAVEHDAERSATLGKAWNAGLRTFWRILALRVAEVVFLFAVAAVLVGIGFASVAASGFSSNSFGSLGLLFFLILLVGIATQVVVTLAIRAAVMDDRSITDAVGVAIALARRPRRRL